MSWMAFVEVSSYVGKGRQLELSPVAIGTEKILSSRMPQAVATSPINRTYRASHYCWRMPFFSVTAPALSMRCPFCIGGIRARAIDLGG